MTAMSGARSMRLAFLIRRFSSIVVLRVPALRAEGAIQLAGNLLQCHGAQSPFRDDDEVAGWGEPILGGPEVFAEEPLDPISNDGVPYLTARGDSKATASELIVGEINDEVGRGPPRPPGGGPPVVTTQEQPLILGKPAFPGARFPPAPRRLR